MGIWRGGVNSLTSRQVHLVIIIKSFFTGGAHIHHLTNFYKYTTSHYLIHVAINIFISDQFSTVTFYKSVIII